MSNVDALIGSKPRILYIGTNLSNEWITEIEYDLPSSAGEIPCTVEMVLSMQEVREWCKRLGV